VLNAVRSRQDWRVEPPLGLRLTMRLSRYSFSRQHEFKDQGDGCAIDFLELPGPATRVNAVPVDRIFDDGVLCACKSERNAGFVTVEPG
jgi:hypothetical protein